MAQWPHGVLDFLGDEGGSLGTANSVVPLELTHCCFKNHVGHNAEAFRASNWTSFCSPDASQVACELPNARLLPLLNMVDSSYTIAFVNNS
jgi:hypothetical protein